MQKAPNVLKVAYIAYTLKPFITEKAFYSYMLSRV